MRKWGKYTKNRGEMLPRNNRKYAFSQIYHVMLRGINKSIIFNDDTDRRKFLKVLKETKDKYNYEIYAYCLMNNHVHIIIFDCLNQLSKIIQRIAVSYSSYYNKKYERVGHLFQNRFKSKCVENDAYLKSLVRYIHQNPEKAGICLTNNYKWSSFNDFLSDKTIINKKYVLRLFDNDVKRFISFNTKNYKSCEDEIEFEFLKNIDDKIAIELIKEKLKIDDIDVIRRYNVKTRNHYLKQVINLNGISKRQICRIFNISYRTLERI